VPTRDEALEIPVGDDDRLAATLVAPATRVPGFLFVHGWGGGQEQYLARARAIAALGCVCLTFDLRGHARSEPRHADVTREDNLRDALAAYDLLAGQRAVDRDAVAVVGSSYGGYLAAILTSLRPVRWLGLRAPALYRDEDWAAPKRRLDRRELAAYRRRPVGPGRTGRWAPAPRSGATCWWSSPSATTWCRTRRSRATWRRSGGRVP
jgi:pimeloyl-ACP methyl ester carboxylesterase